MHELKILSIKKRVEMETKIAMLDGVTPHSARATFITQALENNCPIKAVQKTVERSLRLHRCSIKGLPGTEKVQVLL